MDSYSSDQESFQEKISKNGANPNSDDSNSQSQRLLEQILQTLKESTIAQENHGNDIKSRFWATYHRQASDYDDEFLDRYNSDMDIVLIFAGLFSAVSTAFITAMQPNLIPDPTDTTNALLRQVIHVINSSTFAGQDLDIPLWNGPNVTVIWVQSLAFASLSASLLAALGAVLGKQWLGNYRQQGFGTIEERGRRRQQKLDGINTWHFYVVLDILPVLLQISLLLFNVALSAYVWGEESTIGAVVITTTAFGVVCYTAITVASLFSRDCPYQTPLSKFLPAVWKFIQYAAKKIALGLITVLFFPLLVALGIWFYGGQGILDTLMSPFHRTSHLVNHFRRRFNRRKSSADGLSDLEFSLPPPRIHLDIRSNPINELQSPGIDWLLQVSTDPDVIAAAANMVPEVEWPVEIRVERIFEQLMESFRGCFLSVVDEPNQVQIVPFARERAIACGKAVVHLYCDRLLTRFTPSRMDEFNTMLLPCYSALSQADVASAKDKRDLFACNIAQLMFGFNLNREQSLFRSPDSRSRTWIFHLLPSILLATECPAAIQNFALTEVVAALRPPFPDMKTIADCFVCAALITRVPIYIDRNEMVKVDKSSAVNMLFRELLKHLSSEQSVSIDLKPSFFLGSSGWYARKLLQPISLCLEMMDISGSFGECEAESSQCSCVTVEQGLRIYKIWIDKVDQATSVQEDGITSEDEAKTWTDVRAALHFAAVASCGEDKRDRWHPTYKGNKDHGRPIIGEWAIQALDNHCEARDDVAVADTFFMLSQARDLINPDCEWAQSPTFINSLIFAMQPTKSTIIRHAALRATWEIRKRLISPNDSILPLLPELSAALRSAVLTNIHDSHDETSPDRFLYYERDIHYLQIIYSLSQNPTGIWDALLRDDGHLDRCFSVTVVAYESPKFIPVYFIATVETLLERSVELDFSDSMDRKWRYQQLFAAWKNVTGHSPDYRWQIQEPEDILAVLISFSRRCRDIFGDGFIDDNMKDEMGAASKAAQKDPPVSKAIRDALQAIRAP